MSKKAALKPGGVDGYISGFPQEVQCKLLEIRKAIQSAAPKAIETMSYFDMPGYAYEGYDANGMFAWFSVKGAFVRLHVRPKALVKHSREIAGFTRTKAVINFPLGGALPKGLIKKLVKASIEDMKGSA